MPSRLITAEETAPLRLAILRPGRPAEDVRYDGDHDSTTFHVGTFLDNPQRPPSENTINVAIATMLRQDDPRCGASPAYRLRGMAVATDHQRTGCGSATLRFAEEEVARRGGIAVWCYARLAAIPFYEAHGYESVGDEFDVPIIGPHYFCRKFF